MVKLVILVSLSFSVFCYCLILLGSLHVGHMFSDV